MNITAAATVVPVSNLASSIRFYVEYLGFTEAFRHGNYAGFERGNCLIHLSLDGNSNTGNPGETSVYCFCDDVDRFYLELADKNVAVESRPQNYSYGMREFLVKDPDGNRFTFGSPVHPNEERPEET